MNLGEHIARIRKEKGLSRDELGEQIGTSGAVIGRYERNEIKPSIEVAQNIAKAFNISLDFLVGNSSLILKDQNMIDRLESIEKMSSDEKKELFNVMDALILKAQTKRSLGI